MTKKGKELVAPLEAMLMAARVDLPDVADAFLDANREVANTAYSDNALAGRRTYKPWQELRDEFQRILGKTASTMNDAALALERVVEYYVETDEAAAVGLRREIAGTVHGKRPHIGEPRMPEE